MTSRASTRLLHRISPLVAACAMGLGAGGCVRTMYNPEMATQPYPMEFRVETVTTADGRSIERPRSVDIHVFRRGESIEVVNATAQTYRDFDLWINQRFVNHVELLPAGETITLSLWDFWDVRGERMNAGGFWRTEAPTPVQLAEIQPAEGEPLVGLITIRPRD